MASNLTERKELPGAVKMTFTGRREQEQENCTSKKQVGYCKVTFLIGDGVGLSYTLLTSADQVVPD